MTAPMTREELLKEGARLSNWLATYGHDLMEDGNCDQEAAELNRAAQWIADHLSIAQESGRGMSDVAVGWAVVSGQILVNTVSETRRAAIVNYLVTKHAINITNKWSDEDIERCWAHWGAYSQCSEVSIVAASPATLQDRGQP